MRGILVSVSVAVLFLAMFGISVAGDLSDEDMAAIKATSEALAAAAVANDAEALAATYTEDAILLPPNAPRVEGRAAIQEYFSTFPTVTSFEINVLEVGGVGDVVYVMGTFSMGLDMGGEEPVIDTGKYLDIRKKQADGSWLFYRDMFNSDLAVAAE